MESGEEVEIMVNLTNFELMYTMMEKNVKGEDQR
ncbi:MAG: hypothetical protein PWQ79_977 [Thermococcaceae archaeon]|nr:hypothetical protein [Thermococcaceae archaeon]MDK2914062.1 hypothetical protein [Thermococcaceae archaeon]